MKITLGRFRGLPWSSTRHRGPSWHRGESQLGRGHGTRRDAVHDEGRRREEDGGARSSSEDGQASESSRDEFVRSAAHHEFIRTGTREVRNSTLQFCRVRVRITLESHACDSARDHVAEVRRQGPRRLIGVETDSNTWRIGGNVSGKFRELRTGEGKTGYSRQDSDRHQPIGLALRAYDFGAA